MASNWRDSHASEVTAVDGAWNDADTINGETGSDDSPRLRRTAKIIAASSFLVAYILLLVTICVPIFDLGFASATAADASGITKLVISPLRLVLKTATGQQSVDVRTLVDFPYLNATQIPDNAGQIQAVAGAVSGLTYMAHGVIGCMLLAILLGSIYAIVLLVGCTNELVQRCRGHDPKESQQPGHHSTWLGQCFSDMHTGMQAWGQDVKARKNNWVQTKLPTIIIVCVAVMTAVVSILAILVGQYALTMSKVVYTLPISSQVWISINSLFIYCTFGAALSMWIALCSLLFVSPCWTGRTPGLVDNRKRLGCHSRDIKGFFLATGVILVFGLWISVGILDQVKIGGASSGKNADTGMSYLTFSSKGQSKGSTTPGLGDLANQGIIRDWMSTGRNLFVAACIPFIIILLAAFVEATSRCRCWADKTPQGGELTKNKTRHDYRYICCLRYSKDGFFTGVSITLALFCVAAIVFVPASAGTSLSAWSNLAHTMNQASSNAVGSAMAQLSFLPVWSSTACLVFLSLLTSYAFMLATHMIGPSKIVTWISKRENALSLGAIVLALFATALYTLPLVSNFKDFRLVSFQSGIGGGSNSAPSGFDIHMLQACPITAYDSAAGPCSIDVAMPFVNADRSGVLDSSTAGKENGGSQNYMMAPVFYKFGLPIAILHWLVILAITLRYKDQPYDDQDVKRPDDESRSCIHIVHWWRRLHKKVNMRNIRHVVLIVSSLVMALCAWINVGIVLWLQVKLTKEFESSTQGVAALRRRQQAASGTSGKVVKKYGVVADVVLVGVLLTVSTAMTIYGAVRLLRPKKGDEQPRGCCPLWNRLSQSTNRRPDEENIKPQMSDFPELIPAQSGSEFEHSPSGTPRAPPVHASYAPRIVTRESPQDKPPHDWQFAEVAELVTPDPADVLTFQEFGLFLDESHRTALLCDVGLHNEKIYPNSRQKYWLKAEHGASNRPALAIPYGAAAGGAVVTDKVIPTSRRWREPHNVTKMVRNIAWKEFKPAYIKSVPKLAKHNPSDLDYMQGEFVYVYAKTDDSAHTILVRMDGSVQEHDWPAASHCKILVRNRGEEVPEHASGAQSAFAE